MLKCNHEPTAADRARMERFLRLPNRIENAENFLVLQIKYIVIPLTSEGNISNAQIEAQHQVINANFQAIQNAGDIPQTAHYPYRSIMADPFIAFEPVDNVNVTARIERLNTPTSPPSGGYSAISQLETEFKAQGGTIEDGVIYVYISTLAVTGGGRLLGFAEGIISNACAVDYMTVGSAASPGPSSSYGQGKTLVHELGHCFGLYHPFASLDGSFGCDSPETAFVHSQNPQSPLQIRPNIAADVSLVPTTDNAQDNRGRDELRFCTGSPDCSADTTNGLYPGDTTAVAAYSCASRAELTQADLPYETFMIFMDYGDDENMLGFPSFTVNTMRSVILNHPSLFTVAQTPDISVIPEPTSDEGFPVWAIVLISVVGGLLVLGLVGWGIWKAEKDKRGFKPSVAYFAPEATAHKRYV